MKAKLNRGPMNGKYVDVQGGSLTIEVAEPIKDFNPFNTYATPEMPIVKRGSYQKSNVTLKNGARVYEWMGWYQNAS